MLDVKSLLVVDSSAFGVMVKASRIEHECVGPGMFSNRLFGAVKTVGDYYGAFNYSNLATQKQV